MDAPLEIRGLYYRLIKDVFPQIGEIVGPELGRFYDDIDVDAWYDGEPFFATLRYLKEFISPQVMVLIGGQFMEMFQGYLKERGITTTRALAAATPGLYRELVRGTTAGEWIVEDFRPGRAVVVETGTTGAGSDFALGVLKGALNAVNASNVRTTVLDDQKHGASVNRYLVEWLEGPGVE